MMQSGRKPLSFYLLLLAILSVSAVGIVWAWWPQYELLAQKADIDQAAFIAKLDAEGIDYQLDAQGQLWLETSQVGRGQVLQQQDPKGGFAVQGLELYDKVDYSMTEHTQQVTLQRALQGELERTLAGLNFVRYARVHLSLPEKKLFDADKVAAKAAVTVFPKQQLNSAQIDGIQTLVAAAIEGMRVENVTVLAEDGRLLSRTQEASEWRQQQGQEAQLQAKLEHVLGLLFTPGDFAVSVSVELNHTEFKQISQQLLTDDKGQGALVSKKESTQKSAAGNPAQMPGGLTQQTELKYSHGTKTEEISRKAGEVAKLAVAVIVRKNISAAEQAQITNTIEATIGYQAERGDQLSVQFMAPTALGSAAEVLPVSVDEPVLSEDSKVTTAISDYLWFVLIPLLVAVGAFFVRYKSGVKRLPLQKREALLQDVQAWLSQDQKSHG